MLTKIPSLATFRAQQREIVVIRSGGICEKVGCNNKATEVDHTLGRGSIISAPLCERAELLSHLCHECHANKTDEKSGVDEIRWTAISRFLASRNLHWELAATRTTITGPDTAEGLMEVTLMYPWASPVEAARYIERYMKADTDRWESLWA